MSARFTYALFVFLLVGLSHTACSQDNSFSIVLDPNSEEYPHAHVMVEGWYTYGFFHESGHEDPSWMVFTSFQKTFLGRYHIQALYDLNKGLIHYSGLTEKGQAFLPEAHKRMDFNKSFWNRDTMQLICDKNSFTKTDSLYLLTLYNEDFQLKTKLNPVSDFVLARGNGFTGISKPEHLKYYFLPNLSSKGEFTIDRQQVPIEGNFWYEHIWGRAWPPLKVKWNWWSLKLANGTSILISYTRKQKNDKLIQVYCTIVDSLGKVENFETLKIHPLSTWKSPKTAIEYPIEWEIDIPTWDYSLRINPYFQNCELPVALTKFFWEGPCQVKAIHKESNEMVAGRGIQELVGYGKK